MRRSGGRLTMVLAMTSVSLATPAAAQTPATSTPAAGCTYSACALRIERGFFRNSIVQGAAGEPVDRLSAAGGGVKLLLSGPDSAANYARSYVHASRRAAVLGLLGVVGYTVVLIRTEHFRGRSDAVDAVIGLGSAGLAVASAHYSLGAQRSLSRSIWWYNAALPR